MKVLVINAGSSSLKYQVIDSETEHVLAKGLCERIGIDGRMTYQPAGRDKIKFDAPMPAHRQAVELVLKQLTDPENGVLTSVDEIDAVGYTSRIGKIVLAIIRSFPEIVLALMFIKAVGPGSAAGVLALGFHSVGMLAKLFSEAIENLDDGPNEAVVAAGGSKFHVVMFSTLPNLMPALISNTLYRFDVSIRSASILGLVGAGGIGYPLIIALQYRQWDRVGIILLGIIIMVVIIDWISGWIRKKLV